jgi:hypothetical protein
MPPPPSAREYTLEEVVSPTLLPASAIFSASGMNPGTMCHFRVVRLRIRTLWSFRGPHNDCFQRGGRRKSAGKCAFSRRSLAVHWLLRILLPDDTRHFPPCCVLTLTKHTRKNPSTRAPVVRCFGSKGGRHAHSARNGDSPTAASHHRT